MHIDKAKASQVGGLIMHDERACDNHTNEKINPLMSYRNFNLCNGRALDNYNRRMKQVHMRKNKSANAIAMLTTTMPDSVPAERTKEFFSLTHKFYCSKFGKENVISDWVHMDETRPHSHFKVIPVYWNEQKQQETVSFDRVFSRNVYRSIHRELQQYLEKEMGIPVPILNGATAGGNKTIKELKAAELDKKIKENEALINRQEELIRKNNQVLDKQVDTHKARQKEIEQMDTELRNKKEEDKKLTERIKELLEYIQPLELLNSVVESLYNFKLQFQDTIEWIFKKMYINERQEAALNDFYNFIQQSPYDMDQTIQIAAEISEELNSQAEDHDQDYDEFEL